MELRQLKHLVSISDYGTLSRAAEGLFLSTSALSRSMKNLELELGVALFERTGNKVELNAVGREAVEKSRYILSEVDTMRENLLALSQSRSGLRVGSCAPSATWYLMTKVNEHSPNLLILPELLGEREIVRKLEKNEIDLGVLSFPCVTGRLEGFPLFEETMCLSVPQGHPLSASSTVSFSDLDGETFLLHLSAGRRADMLRSRLPHSNFVYQNDYMAFTLLFESTSMLSFTDDLSMLSHVISRIAVPLDEEEARVTYYLAWKKERYAEWQLVIEQIRECEKEIELVKIES